MKLLLIYGPPAAGKLTVSEAIAAKTKFKVFHNHKTLDIFKDILEYDSEGFWDSVHKLRLELIELAAKKDVDIIFTFCYEPHDMWFVKKIVEIIDRFQGETFFVMLACKKEEAVRRVTGETRERHEKIKSPEKLEKCFESHDFYSKIDLPNSIVIDNTEKSAEAVADEVISTFKL